MVHYRGKFIPNLSDIADKKGDPEGEFVQGAILKEKSGVKLIWDMFSMITTWNVRLAAKKRIYIF